ncbi:unannotated protein [freshwater metagenome]|uniref:Unannotated protein n=1 Tax=freshwater metagenome TaxID=449393 RepID=A0A6J7BZM5_9ZZZZ
MPSTAVADEIDHDVFVELLAEIEREPTHADDGFGVVAVDVEDRSLHHTGDIGAVDGRARGLGCGGEADLVVHDDVHRAPGAIAAELGEVEGFGYYALACEGRIAMKKNWQHREHVPPRQDVLLGAHDSLEHGVHGFKVRGVGREIDGHFSARLGGEGTARAEVVLHVSGALHGPLDLEVALELAEYLAVRLSGDVGEHVQAPSVRHADARLVQAALGRRGDDRVHEWDHRFGALEGEPLLAHVLGLQEGLEGLGGVEASEDS